MGDDFHFLHGADTAEEIVEVGLGGVVAEVAEVETRGLDRDDLRSAGGL